MRAAAAYRRLRPGGAVTFVGVESFADNVAWMEDHCRRNGVGVGVGGGGGGGSSSGDRVVLLHRFAGTRPADASEPGEVSLLEILEHAGEGDVHLIDLDCQARVGGVWEGRGRGA